MSFSTNTFNSMQFSSSNLDFVNLSIDFTIGYSISNAVTQSVTVGYNIEERVSVDLDIVYDSVGFITVDFNVPYSIEEGVSIDFGVNWFTQGLVEATVTKNKVCAKSAPNKVSICY